MSPRLARAARLVDIASQAEQNAKQRAAVASRREEDARLRVTRAEVDWSDAAEGPLPAGAGALDLERLDAHLKTLRARVEAAARAAVEAASMRALCAKASIDAATERRKLELWVERLQGAEIEATTRAEQKASDELAASGWRARA